MRRNKKRMQRRCILFLFYLLQRELGGRFRRGVDCVIAVVNHHSGLCAVGLLYIFNLRIVDGYLI